MIEELQAMHDLIMGMYPQNRRVTTAYGLVLTHGVDFQPMPRGRDVQKLRDKECFSNALNMVVQDPTLIYVEGYAVPDFLPICIHHAWVMDREGNMCDPTWKTPGAKYRGIPIKTDYAIMVAHETGYYGILDNHLWRGIYEESPDIYLHRG